MTRSASHPTATILTHPAPTDPLPLEREQRRTLERLCAGEMAGAFGLGDTAWPLFRLPARRLARKVAIYDAIVGNSGLAAGGAWALERMSRKTEVSGAERIPPAGPLLVVSNHPGLADAVALFAALAREDLRVVAAERPFLEALPNTSRCLFPFPETPAGRFRVVRAAARHLRGGGALLTFPAGRIEPDPAVLPGALASLDRWSASIDLFARLAPDLQVAPAIVSGVLSPAALGNPLTRLRREARDREWLAATLQILTPSLYDVTVRVEFGPPVRASDHRSVTPAVVAEARRLVRTHHE